MTSSTPERQALAVVQLIRADRFDELQRRFLPMLRGVISTTGLRDAWRAKVARHGELSAVGDPTVTPGSQGITVARVELGFERGTVIMAISMLEQHLVNIAVEDVATGHD